MPYWEETIAPALKAGKTVFVAAHGNSIRAIVKMIPGPEISVFFLGRSFAWVASKHGLYSTFDICRFELDILRIEGLSDDVIPGLEIPTGTPLVYELDKERPVTRRLSTQGGVATEGVTVN